MSEVFNFDGGLRVQQFRSGRYVEWRLFNANGFLKARGHEVTKVKCEKRWRPLLEKMLKAEI
jgi:hypothetical protein